MVATIQEKVIQRNIKKENQERKEKKRQRDSYRCRREQWESSQQAMQMYDVAQYSRALAPRLMEMYSGFLRSEKVLSSLRDCITFHHIITQEEDVGFLFFLLLNIKRRSSNASRQYSTTGSPPPHTSVYRCTLPKVDFSANNSDFFF